MLRHLILTGALVPGQRLNENELADRLEMSRGPVRESLQTLAAEGLVVVRSHKGTFVRTFGPKELVDLYDVRAVLECHAVRQAAHFHSEEEIAAMDKMLDLASERLATEGAFLYDNDFHGSLLSMAHNDVLMNLGRQLLGQIALARSQSARSRERSLSALEEHKRIFEAICNSDVTGASELMDQHLRHSYANVQHAFDSTASTNGSV